MARYHLRYPGRRPGEEPQKRKMPVSKLLWRLWNYIGKYRLMVVLALVLSVSGTLAGLYAPKLSGYAINAIDLGAGQVDFQTVFRCVIWMLVCYVASSVLAYLLHVVMLKISRSVSRQMRQEVFAHLQELPVNFFDRHQTGDIISSITYDIDTVNQSLSNDLLRILQSLLTVVVSLILMLTIVPKMVTVFLFSVVAAVLFARFYTTKIRERGRQAARKRGELNGFVDEILSGQKTIAAYAQEEPVREQFEKHNTEVESLMVKMDSGVTVVHSVVQLINNISLALVCTFGALMFAQGQVRLGDLSSFVQYSRRFSDPITDIANIVSDLQRAFSAAERVFRLLDEEPEQPDAPDAVELTAVHGDVRLNHVDFSYDPGKPIIQDLCLHAKPGSLTAIVGPTGAGKTTIINLLMRFYDVDSGSITVDGHDIRNITRASLRKAYSMVLQDTWLFHGTIFENIAYGKPGATMEEVVAAAKAAHIHGFISRLPKGYDTMLSDNGTSVSKGQKQLLTIARAMMLDAHMLILDEATSDVDTRTEEKIQSAMRLLMQNKTCFVIAHRLSTIRSADNILVLDGGKVVEQGTHESLMAQKGTYYTLYKSQFDAVS